MQAVTNRFIRLFFAVAAIVSSSPALADYAFLLINDPALPIFTEVFGINNAGQVAGIGLTSFIYDSKKGGYTRIADAPGSLGSSVLGINEPGVMVGALSFDGLTESAFVRSKNGAYTAFSHPGCTDTEARAINNTGLVTGHAFGCSPSDTVGFIYDPARNVFIDILPGEFTIAQGISNSGQVVGSVALDAGIACTGCPRSNYGFLRAASGAITLFRVNGHSTTARGITDSGLVTGSTASKGYVTSLAGLPYEAITIPDAELLVFPGATSTSPEGISNAGDIVGIWSDAPSGGFPLHGFIATPLPPKK